MTITLHDTGSQRYVRDHTTSLDAPAGAATILTDWRTEIPERRRAHLRRWLWTGAALTFLIVVIGGITRLTQSGLSIVDWDPIMGVIPPIGEAEWREAFARYQQFPEYQRLRGGMTLGEFRFIFFWEYLHRLAARLIGLVFLVPVAFFWARAYLNPPLRRRLLVLFGLGALQGFMGWFMVRSGLVDDPRVSHYRLAAHLTIALAIFSYCVWLTRELSAGRAGPPREEEDRGALLPWIASLGVLLLLQILWGAFVAGLDAGLIFNTFPLMNGGLLPPQGLEMEPALRNLLENPATVQWVHRLLGTTLLLTAIVAALRAKRRTADARSVRLASAFAILVAAQFTLGVLTLLLAVPVPLGVAHQATAVLITAVWLFWLHHSLNGSAGGALANEGESCEPSERRVHGRTAGAAT
jgi:cytochrome c oxidase assembly protein subunit 15